ncbi:MAG: alpha-L-arabinofuranosidase C-terminal domain-containing protein [Promethearchaeota archaeon]|jgi:alpha-N-arabinofuranosidase
MAEHEPSIKINLNESIGKINPFVLGQFIEHFPRQIYGGIYEEGSPHSDSNGYRLDVEQALKDLEVPILRWPGGNYTSGYHWKWGTGPKSERIARKNPVWDESESHHFGTTEFVEYCRRIGTEPMICVGVGSSDENPTPEEAAAWVRYCNAVGGPEAELRTKAGYPDPLNVKWWGLGNEVWGPWQIGYYKNGRDYGEDALEFIKVMKKSDTSLKFVAVGVDPSILHPRWNMHLLSNDELTKEIDALAWHHYLQIGDPDERISHANASTGLRKVERKLSRVIREIQKACKRIGRDDLIQIAITEWNEYGWIHNPWTTDVNDENKAPEQYDLAHALYTAGFLNIILRKAANISIANYSPVVNTRGLIYADERGVLLRSTYFVFQMYKPCTEGTSILTQIECPKLDDSSALVLDVAAVKVSDTRVYLFVVNRALEDLTCQITIPNFGVKSSSGIILTSESLKSYNSFEHPDTITPREFEVKVSGETFKISFPKHSLSVLLLE